MKNHIFLLGLTMMAMIGCSRKPDMAKIIGLQNELTEKWDKAMNAGDADALASFYTEDAVRMTPNEPAWKGKEAIRNGFRSLLEKNKVKGVNTVADVILAEDYAMVRGTSKYDVIPKTGGEPVHGEGKYVDIRKLQPDGSWKSVLSIWNSNLPLADVNK